MCDCSSLNAHLLLGEFSCGRRLRSGGPSRCCTKARSTQDLGRGSGSVVLCSKSGGWRARLPREVSWVARKIATLSESPDPLRRGCFGVERGGRDSVWVSRNSGDYQPERYESLKEVVFPGASAGGLENAHLGPSRKPEEDGERSTRDNSASSSFDILELKRELEKEEREAGITDRLKGEGDLIPAEDFERALSDSEEENRLDRVSGFRNGRQMLRRSSLIAKQVISMQSARSLGFVSELWVDTTLWIVVVVEVKPNLLSGEIEKLLLEDVHQVGDVVLVQDESVMENEVKMIGLDTLVGYDVVTSGRRNIGKVQITDFTLNILHVRGYNFDINSGAVESLELDSFGMSIIPAGLVSTYCLMVEDVIEVLSTTIVVHEVAASRLQRLTKGFWSAPKSEASLDDIVDSADFRRRTNRSVRRRRRGQDFSRRKFQDDWDLPMDF
ncbi:hypothetical protein Taro_053764 [Colocasia esculenta]|uniref:PRC-barrel domain-containing protein n=1 Tax=Colocasia esculenta TaxID=4460 RepID=A0A843XLT9_COLES|nr:hypothetical protein [Colocasia esculenta]